MKSSLQSFGRELEKTAYGPVSHDIHGQEYESMTWPKWKQTIKDFPSIVLGSGLGYGLGKTITDQMLVKAIESGDPNFKKILPHTPEILAGATGLALTLNSLLHARLKERREEAQRKHEAHELTQRAQAAGKAPAKGAAVKQAHMDAFFDELEKKSFATALGKALVGLGGRGASLIGQGKNYGSLIRKGMTGAKGGANQLYKNVGVGATAVGGTLAASKLLSSDRPGQ